jgi:DNA-binding response OmpR family regulator
MEDVESGSGLSRAIEEVPAAIIMDEDMSPIDGIELLPVLRSYTDSLIVVKGSGGGQAAAQALLLGADIYLPRSVSVKEALTRIHALLRRLATRTESSKERDRTSGNGSHR